LAMSPMPQPPLDPQQALLSVLIPVYNERETIDLIVEQVRATPIRKEIICVDDHSTDGTQQILETLLAQGKIDQLFRQSVNRGKGAAIRHALSMSRGDIVIVQDADLEYDPNDWPVVLEPIFDGRADASFGSRFLGGPHRVLYYWHSVGNHWLTRYSNMLTNLNLTDMETCYKVMRTEVLRSFTLESNGFGIEPELTAKIFKRHYRVYEIPITYDGRNYDEGKKITWRDGFVALWVLLKYRFTE